MSAYMIAQISVSDPEQFKLYGAAAGKATAHLDLEVEHFPAVLEEAPVA